MNRILTDDGMLILIEVLSLTKGEQSYDSNGYLILQDEQVGLLFTDSHITSLRVNPNETNGSKKLCFLFNILCRT